MGVYMRNKASGEIRDVESDSQEFRDLQAEVTSNGLPMWEQTSHPHADAIRSRAEEDALQEEDLGHVAQDELRFEAMRLNDQGVAPEANPHLALTPAEIEAGLTPQSKLQDLEEMYDERVGKRRAIFNEAAEVHVPKDERKPAPTGEGASARAGGSDTRSEAPLPTGEGGE